MLQPAKKTFWDRLEAMWALSPYALVIAAVSVVAGAALEAISWPWRITVFVVLFLPVVMLIRGVARVAREKAQREMDAAADIEASK